jgi:hypothetical protein
MTDEEEEGEEEETGGKQNIGRQCNGYMYNIPLNGFAAFPPCE